MKKIISLFLIVLTLITLCACSKEEEKVVEKIKTDIPNAYTGDIQVEDKVDCGELDIMLKESIFYIKGRMFRFSDFKNTEKLSTNFGDEMLDVYVTDGKLIKCAITSADSTVYTEYDSEGKAICCTKTVYDDYYNATFVAHYDGDGKLLDFYDALYAKDCVLKEKREYNSTYDLIDVIRYYYDDDGNLIKEAVYGPDLKLIEIKTY